MPLCVHGRALNNKDKPLSGTGKLSNTSLKGSEVSKHLFMLSVDKLAVARPINWFKLLMSDKSDRPTDILNFLS